MFYINNDKNGPKWKLVHKFSPKHLCDIPDVDKHSVTVDTNENPILQDENSFDFRIYIELMVLYNISINRDDVEPKTVENIEELLREGRIVGNDYFMIDDDQLEFDDILDEYDDEEIVHVDSDSDVGVNDTFSDDDV